MEKSINRLPVCDKNGFPVGIVTRSDLVNAICLQGVNMNYFKKMSGQGQSPPAVSKMKYSGHGLALF
ncbi:MAG: CBS domain-containing protein [Desulfobacteraceae bacterium]|nr:CBS domain-containing protein [Desulfobacteraceae bacterium]